MPDRPVALVTGASSGIGKDLARVFARENHDLVIVARGEERLRALAGELPSTKVTVIPADLGAPGAPAEIFAACEAAGVTVDVLVNNAGFGSNGAFLDLDLEREAQMIDVNCTALLRLTHLFGTGMRARGRGKILNVGSTAGFQPGPFMATYYASKALVVSFSEALSDELAGTGVTVTCLCPGPVATEFADRAGNARSKLFQSTKVASSAEIAEFAYQATMRGQLLAIPTLVQRLQFQSLRVAPRSVVRGIAARLNRS
ncbi:MAG: SDR family oxidoreductase [Myxococcales bacterium]|nr:SDR family oxidoreductase [Myxococcales bacterium]